jgi:hypothetical protein
VNTYADILAAFNDVTRDSGRYFFTAAQVDRFANRAVDEVARRSRCILENEVVNSVSGTLEYAISADGYAVRRVEYDGEALMPISHDKLRYADRNWEQRSGRPKFYYLDEIYDSQEYLTVGVWEAPSTDDVNIRIWYDAVPRALENDKPTAEVEVPDWAVGSVLFYMLYLAYTSDTKMQNFQTAAIYKLMYEDIMGRLELRSNDRNPKKWVSGQPSTPSLSILNRLPQRITE